MEFLPLEINSEKVYVGFWKRFCAGCADTIILIPPTFLLVWLESFGISFAMLIAVPFSFLFAIYNVYFNARFGGTLGKLAVGIRIAKPNGTSVGWPEAWKRSSVDLAFALLFLEFDIQALRAVDPDLYYTTHWLDLPALLEYYYPPAYNLVYMLFMLWALSELFVLLFNDRKRAIHDFIAGTVVIKKEFLEIPPEIVPPETHNPQ